MSAAELTPVDLAAMREALAAATSGRWQLDGPFWWRGGDQNADCCTLITAGDDRLPVVVLPEDFDRRVTSDADAALIIAAVNTLPDLLDELDAARATIARARELADTATRSVIFPGELRAALDGQAPTGSATDDGNEGL